LLDKRSRNFKEDLALSYKKQGKRIVYIGDGTADLPPAEHAEMVFSVAGSSLSKLCERESLSHIDFLDFAEIVARVEEKQIRP